MPNPLQNAHVALGVLRNLKLPSAQRTGYVVEVVREQICRGLLESFLVRPLYRSDGPLIVLVNRLFDEVEVLVGVGVVEANVLAEATPQAVHCQ